MACFARLFATGHKDAFNKKNRFCCMLCKGKIAMSARGLYEFKHEYQRDCHFRAYQ